MDSDIEREQIEFPDDAESVYPEPLDMADFLCIHGRFKSQLCEFCVETNEIRYQELCTEVEVDEFLN